MGGEGGGGGGFFFFFFKQKTAYEIYQCDWSSDVCSSDLAPVDAQRQKPVYPLPQPPAAGVLLLSVHGLQVGARGRGLGTSKPQGAIRFPSP